MNAILLAQLTPLSVAALVFVAAVTWMLLLRANRHYRSQRSAPLPAVQAKQRAAARSHGGVMPREVEQWEVRMHDLARELSGQLDSKISALQHLVNLAESRVAELEELLEKVDAQQEPTSGAGTQAAGIKPPSTRQAQVYALADAGHDRQSIAAILGSPIGEVDLMLGLRQ